MSSNASKTNFDLNYLAENQPSMCIPRVFENISERQVREVFEQLDLGQLDHIDIIERSSEKGEKYKRIFIHFSKWYWNDDAITARRRLIEGKDIKVVYNMPWFWKISANRWTGNNNPSVMQRESNAIHEDVRRNVRRGGPRIEFEDEVRHNEVRHNDSRSNDRYNEVRRDDRRSNNTRDDRRSNDTRDDRRSNDTRDDTRDNRYNEVRRDDTRDDRYNEVRNDRRNDRRSNDRRHNEVRNDTRSNDTRSNDTRYNDTRSNDTRSNDRRNDRRSNDRRHNEVRNEVRPPVIKEEPKQSAAEIAQLAIINSTKKRKIILKKKEPQPKIELVVVEEVKEENA